MTIHFPQAAALRDGSPVLIRPFTADDREALYAFFRRLPEEVRRYAWDRIDMREVIDAWADEVDYDKAIPLLAWDGAQVVADATMHYREGGPLRLVGRLKWLIDPEYRGRGLGTLLVNDFITIGRDRGLRHLTCMLVTDFEADAISTLSDVGFERHDFPGYGAGPDGDPKDMAKMIYRL